MLLSRPVLYSIVATLAVGFILGSGLRADEHMQAVAFTGDLTSAVNVTNPPVSGPFFFGAPGWPVINDAGQFIFRSSFDKLPSRFGPDPSGVWRSGRNGELQSVASERGPAPGLSPTDTFFFIRESNILNSGEVLLSADIGSANKNKAGIWLYDINGDATLVAINETQIPGAAVGTEFVFADVTKSITNARELVLRGRMKSVGSAEKDAIWFGDSFSNLKPIATTGEAAPGYPIGTAFRGVGFPVLTANGRILFHAWLSLAPSVDTTIYSFENSSGLMPIIRDGDEVAGVPSGTTLQFGTLSQIAVHNQGRMVFAANLAGTGVTANDNYALFTGESSGDLRTVAREGQQMPGAPDGVLFGEYIGDWNNLGFSINEPGDIAFWGKLEGAAPESGITEGIWLENAGQLDKVALAGEHAPGLAENVRFREFSNGNSGNFERPLMLNDRGQVAFLAQLTGAEVNHFNDHGIWAQDRTGELRLIVRDSDRLEVRPGEFRTVSLIELLGEFGGPGSFSNQGEVVFTATFLEGGRGVFVSTLVAVPEPSNTILVLSVLICTVANVRYRLHKTAKCSRRTAVAR
jgi:hypothetical protein